MRPSARFVGALLFVSGSSALVYQTAWQRSLRLVFGASTAASAAVLAIFLGGLGAGGLVLGRRADRATKPLLLYGNLELGVALTAGASPLLIEVLGRGYIGLGGTARLGTSLATVLRLLVTLVAIGPSVFLMGGTLPAAARAVESDDDQGRSRLAFLYGMNTFGAVTGALLGTFALFEVFGTRSSLWIGALLNALAAMIARSVGRDAEDVPVSAPTEPSAFVAGGPPLLAYAVAFGVGAAFLLLEIVWYRMLAPILGGSTYTFGLVLAVALFGIGLGGWLYSRHAHDRPATLGTLATVTALEAVLVGVPLALGDRIAVYAALTRPLSALGFPALVLSWATITFLVVLPAAAASGYQFPLLFALLGRGRAQVARQVGVLYAFNTVGSIVGSLLGGFVLIPRLGAVGAWRLVIATLVLLSLGTVVLAVFRHSTRRAALRMAPALALCALAVSLASSAGPSAVWRHEPIGAGRAQVPGTSRNKLVAWSRRENERILWQADGVETGVGLRRTDQLAFVVDGKVDGAVFGDRATQAGAGLIGALVHGAPKRALVIGLGTGMTAGWLAAIPEMERVDVAELEPSIVEVATQAAAANQDVLHRPNVRLHFGDGREVVLTSKEHYDMVVSEPSNPYRTGISALYTTEFYQAVSRRLRERGLFVQWVQGYEVDVETFRTIARTLRGVLPYVEVWQSMQGDVLFLASKERRTLDVASLRTRIGKEPFRSGLARTMLISDVEGLLGRFVATDATLGELTSGEDDRVNTDDHNSLDYAFARSVGTTDGELPLRLLEASIALHRDRPEVEGDVDWDRVAELRARAWMVDGSDMPDLPMPGPRQVDRVRAVAAGCIGDVARSRMAWGSPGVGGPLDDVERFTLGMDLAAAGDARTESFAAALVSRGFIVEAELIRAHLAQVTKQPAMAMDAAVRAIVALRREALPLCSAAHQVVAFVEELGATTPEVRMRLMTELLREPFAAYAMDEMRVRVGQKFAIASGNAALCVKALGSRVDSPPWDEWFLEKRLQCLAAAGHPAATKAAADLIAYRSATAGTFTLGNP